MDVVAGVLSHPHPQVWSALGRGLAPGLIHLDDPATETLRVPSEFPFPTPGARELPVWLL